ncbi:MAG: glycosyltransferase family 2 protein, partial [Bacteroidetes bacterium]
MPSPAPGTYRTAALAPPPPTLLDLSVIIVNYNVREFLEQALRSLERARGTLAMEIFVVDNNSVDGSVERVREAFPDVHLIANRENVGFGRANNQAIRQARGRYLLILNPDTIVQEDTLHTLVRFMDEHPDAGAVGCKILNPDGSFAPESRRAFPTPATAFYRITGLSRLFPRSPVFGRYNLTYLPIDQVAEVDALSGSCMLVRQAALWWSREAWEAAGPAAGSSDPPPDPPMNGAGLFDEDFFMYGEDLDWCYRIQRAGWKVYYTPETQIIHYKGESTKKGELRYVRLFYGAMLLFTEKHLENRYSRLMAWALRGSIL